MAYGKLIIVLKKDEDILKCFGMIQKGSFTASTDETKTMDVEIIKNMNNGGSE